ncbi:acetoacetate metabolism regulatory protein AtoC [Verrucomicrobiota bacterium]|nr:acetoacetate metabolism regulatory protein AtoC [Verrucomicrobiota bacterium]
MASVLIIEDEAALATALSRVCQRLGWHAELRASGNAGLRALASGNFDLAILDIGLPDLSGLEVLEKARARAPQLPVVIITAHGKLENAVAARKLGAAAYLVKPLDLREIERTLTQILATASAPTSAAAPASSDAQLLGDSPAMQRVFLEIAHACTTDAPVLLSGPTGSGKTLAARSIHIHSARKNAPFVALHCGALQEQLLESELFGHERGAFTGAVSARPGHIERARGGTLFLDEIGDISPTVQAKLLRFVEERAFTRVGGREDIRVELRLITATNKNLRDEVRAARFREDLFYRLHVLEIGMPPLRERTADLAVLAANFLRTAARPLTLAPASLALLERHDWPGNLRELRNVLEYAAAVCTGPVILPAHLPRDIHEHAASAPSHDARLATVLSEWLDARLLEKATYRDMHDAIESLVLRHLLTRFDGKPTLLARATKMNRVTLRKKFTRE